MRAYLIVVFHVRQQHVTKMSFTQDDDMIDAIPGGSNRSAVQHIRFAMGSAVTLVDHEYPLIGVSDEGVRSRSASLLVRSAITSTRPCASRSFVVAEFLLGDLPLFRHWLELDDRHVAARFEGVVLVEYIGDAARHAGGEISAGRRIFWLRLGV